MNDVIEYLTNGDLSDLSELSEDEDNIDVMINEQTTSKQYDTAGSEDEEHMALAAHDSKPDVAASSEDEDEMSVALLRSTNDPTSSTTSKKTNEKRIFRWRKRDLPQAPHVFSASQLSLSDEPKTPLQYFSILFTDKLIQDIVENTNVEEIKKFIDMNIIMGVIPLPSVYDYWSRSLRILAIADLMPQNRFRELGRYLHFVDNTAAHDSDGKLFKIRPVIEAVRNKCVKVTPEEYYSVDK